MSYKSFFFVGIMFLSISCRNSKQENPVYGNWSAKYIYVDGNELLGYGDKNLAYSLKPAIFTQDGKMIIFLKNENKANIEADFVLTRKNEVDSIIIESPLNSLNGRYKIEFINNPGKLIMKFKSSEREMFFEQISAELYVQ